jgi:release factor glutamine methyltransferase
MTCERVDAWLARAAGRLAGAGLDEPRFEARLLLAHALGWSAESVLRHASDLLSGETLRRADALVERRRRREPAAHILGRREFWGLEFQVTPDVLDPRPDSETLIEAALAEIGGRDAPLRIVDLGTGTGCLMLSLLSMLPNATGLGVDLSAAAVEVARRNADRLGLGDRARFRIGAWGEGVPPGCDLVVANPPYIPTAEIDRLQAEVAMWEPRLALDGGADGLAAYRSLFPAIAGMLRPDGFAAVEIGAEQGDDAAALAAASGLGLRRRVRDLGGRDRCLILALRASGPKKQLEKNGPPSRVVA